MLVARCGSLSTPKRRGVKHGGSCPNESCCHSKWTSIHSVGLSPLYIQCMSQKTIQKYPIKGEDVFDKPIFHKTWIGFSSILQCTGTININDCPWYCTDLCLFTVYAVKEIEEAITC